MADYDLGTAHGRIVIESDSRGSTEAARSLTQIEAAAQSLNRAFANTERALQGFSQNVQGIQQRAEQAEQKVRSFGSTVQGISGGISNAANNVRNLGSELQNLSSQTLDAGRRIETLHGTIEKLTSVRGNISLLAGAFGSADNATKNMPQWARSIQEVNRSITGLKIAGGILGTFGARMLATGTATAALGFIAPRASSAVGALRGLALAGALVSPRFASMGLAVRRFGGFLGLTNGDLDRFGRGVLRSISGVSQMITGVSLMSRGLEGIGRAAKIATLALSGITLAGAGISALGTIALGVWSALKQLSGVAGLLPGLFLGAGTAIGVAKLALHGIGDAAKAAFGDASKFNDAIKDMSPTMQGVAKSLQSVKPQLKGLQQVAQSSVLAGVSTDIKTLTSLYFPSLRNGIGQVGTSLNGIKNGFRDFLTQPATGQDINKTFGLTSHILDNVAKAVWPISAAFRDLGVVGLEVLSDMSDSLGGMGKKFGDFVSEARRTGELKTWIQQGVQGVKDLGTAIKATSQAFGTIFRAFGANGDNALERLANGAERFRDAMQKSSKGGGLETIASTLQRMGSTSFTVLSAALEQVLTALKTLAPFAEEMSNTFSGSLVVVIQTLGTAFNVLASAIANVPALGSIIGSLLAMGIALKGLALLFSPIVRGFQLIIGFALTIRGLVLAIEGVSVAMSTAAGRSALLSAAWAKLTGAAAATAAASILTATLIAAVSVYLIAQSGLSNLAEGYRLMSESSKISEKSVRGFTEAFTEANGVMSKGVFDEGVQQVDNLRSSLKDLADKAPGWKESFADLRLGLDFDKGVGTWHTGQFEDLKVAAGDAKAAADSFDKLGLSNKDLSSAITGSDSAWQGLHDRLAALGADGVKAIDAIFPLRVAFLDTKAAMDKVGPGGVQLANGLKLIGTAGDDASQKLNGLKLALQGLGLIQQTAEAAAFDYQEALRKMGDSATTAADATQPLGQALLNANGTLDATKQNAFNLNQQLQSLATQFLESASKGGNATQMWTDMQPALQSLADAFGLPLPKLQELIAKMGVVPSVVTTIMSLQGADDVKQNLGEVALRALQVNNTPISVIVNSQAALDKLKELGAIISVYDDKTHTATLTLDPTKAQEILTQLQAQTKATTIPAPTVAVPQVPQPNPPVSEQPIPAPKVDVPQVPVPIPPTTQPNVPAPTVDKPVVPQPDPPVITTVPAPTVEKPVIPQPDPITPVAPIKVEIQGVDGVNAGIASINQALADSEGKWGSYATAIGTAMSSAQTSVNGAVSSIGTALSSASSGANASGQALGQGFADGINSKVDAVRAAAMALANAAAAPLPKSPAEIGPFSGQGWTPFRGRKLAEGFAEGISDGTGLAQSAALDLSSAVSNAMDSVRAVFGQPQTSFGANRTPGPSGAKFFRDPTKTDADLQAARDKKTQEAAQTASDTAFREQKKQNETVNTFNQKATDQQTRDTSKATLKADKSDKDLVGAMTKVASAFGLQLTSGQRDEPGSLHSTGQAADFSNGTGTSQELAFAQFVAKNFKPFTKELIFQDPRFAGSEIKNGKTVDSSFFAGSGDKNDHVHWAVDVAPVLSGTIGDAVSQGINTAINGQTDKTTTTQEKSTTDLTASQQQIVDAIVAEGKAQGASNADISAAVSAGIVESNLQNVKGGPDSSTGVFQQQNFAPWTSNGRDRNNVSDAARTFFEQIKTTDPSLSSGERAQAVQKSAFPQKYTEQMARAEQLTLESLQRQGDTNATLDSMDSSLTGLTDTGDQSLSEQDKALNELRANNKALDQSIKTAQDAGSSDAQVIQALQDIEDGIAVTDDPDAKAGLKAVEDAVMEDRGISKFDPNADKSTDPVGDTIKLASTVVGLWSTVKSGLDSATQVAELLIRGVANTDDINTLVDGVQSVFTTVSSVISTVSDVISTVASLAALAGAAIPGIGQIATVVSAVTGGIGNVNSVIDTIQEVVKIGMGIFGGFLSAAAGGAAGGLTGDVHMLLDQNDNTLKTWSTNNPSDKRIHPLGPTPNNTTNNNAPQQMNIFAGPGTDPHQMMNEAMFAIRASAQGVY